MPSPINITTLSGVRLDVNPSATIELNMGGMSLLDLNSRRSTYTNSFSLPRTPTNESVFAFASQPTRNNRPSIDVWITKGLFQRKAVLKVIEFEKEYKCTIGYDTEDIVKQLSELNFYTLPADDVIHTFPSSPSDSELLNKICERRTNGYAFTPVTYNHRVADAGGGLNSNAFTVESILLLVTNETGITFSGDMLTDAQFMNSFIFNKNIYIEQIDNDIIQYKVDTSATIDFMPISKVLKALSNIFFFSINIEGANVELKSATNSILHDNIINLEGFNFSKSLTTKYAKNNTITYKLLDKAVNEFFASDTITGDGIGNKNILSIDSAVPSYYDTTYFGYEMSYKDVLKELCIMASDGATSNTMKTSSTAYTSGITSYVAEPLDMSGFYSNILNPIFANPVILEANKYIDPLTAYNIMTTRVVNSVQLGGRYWVDTMAYNLTTGQSKMTLIKI